MPSTISESSQGSPDSSHPSSPPRPQPRPQPQPQPPDRPGFPPASAGRRLLPLLRPEAAGPLSAEDAAALLSYLTSYGSALGASWREQGRRGDGAAGAAPEDFGTFRSVALSALGAAHRSSSSGGAPEPPPVLGPRIARRILADGLLPLAGIGHPALDALISQCVVDVVLPCCCVKRGDGDEGGGGDEGCADSDIGIETVLPGFLARMSGARRRAAADPAAGGEGGGDGAPGAPSVLDALCAAPASGYALRPLRAAAVASALGELEAIRPGALRGEGTAGWGGGGRGLGRADFLVDALLSSLRALTEGRSDLDSLPPLVYQLCLLPSKAGTETGAGGVELRVRILAGIADVFDGLQRAALVPGAEAPSSSAPSPRGRILDTEALRWAVGTSLAHVGTGLRGDPDLVKAVLRLVRGEAGPSALTAGPAGGQGDHCTAAARLPPFRYLRLTPFRLCLALAAASAMPRARKASLEAIRDLAVEEQTMKAKRSQSPWFNAVAGSAVIRAQLVPADKAIENRAREEYQRPDAHVGSVGQHVLSCVRSVIEFSSSKDGIGTELTGLLQSLISLGFLLVDCVRRDNGTFSPPSGTGSPASSSSSGSNFGTSSTLGPHSALQALISERNATVAVSRQANEAAADCGRHILALLFVNAGSASASSFSSAAGGSVSPLCRSILHDCADKFCGMAPNAVQHSFLLRDLALASICDTRVAFVGSASMANGSAPDILAASFIPTITNYLSNIPGGGMPPAVAIASVVPALGALLHHQIHRRRVRELEDNVDHSFLLAKKALFCTDVQRRAVAVNILVMLIGVVVSSGDNAGSSGATFAAGCGGATLDEIRGYLRRCLTQHQPVVRVEVYASLIALLPCLEDANPSNPESNFATPMPDGSPVPTARRGRADAGRAICHVVADILLSQLDRYTTPEEEKEDMVARRDRATKHGSQLSQMVLDEVDEVDDDGSPSDPPIRIDLCLQEGRHLIETVPLAVNRMAKAGQKKKKTQVFSLLESATIKIAEPLCFLIASCSEFVSAQSSSPAFGASEAWGCQFRSSFYKLRKRVARSKLPDYLASFEKHDENQCDEKTNGKSHLSKSLATCFLVASVAEIFIGTNNIVPGEDPAESTECLFQLRSDAVEKAAFILASSASGKKKEKKKKGGGSERDPQHGPLIEGVELGVIEMAPEMGIKPATLDKARKTVEDVINQMCPSLQVDAFVLLLRNFGVVAELSEGRSQSSHSKGANPRRRLVADMKFRKFLLEKCLRFLDGSGLFLSSGRRFDATSLSWRKKNDSDAVALGTMYVRASMQLGSLLLAEFCFDCSKKNRSSLNKSLPLHEVPLTQLSLLAFTRCVQRASAGWPGHSLSRAARVLALMRTSFRQIENVLPAMKDRLALFPSPASDGSQLSQDETRLRNVAMVFASPVQTLQEKTGINKKLGGFLPELLTNSLYAEAAECIALIACVSMAIRNPNVRQTLGVCTLRCWDEIPNQSWDGVLGLACGQLQSKDDLYPSKCATMSVEAALLLGGQLDGDTSIPKDATFGEKMEKSRAMAFLPSLSAGSWSETHQSYLEKIPPMHGVEMPPIGIALKVSLAMLMSLGFSANFDGLYRSGNCSEKKDFPWSKEGTQLACIDTIIELPKAAGMSAPKELELIADSLSGAIDATVSDAEFVVGRMLPYLDGDVLDQTQEHLAGRLLAAGSIISVLSGCAAHCDDSASFVSSLLRNTKRLYGIYTKLVQSQTKNPRALISTINRGLLSEMAERMTPRTAGLLLTLQEKTEAGEGKFITDKKIESHGRIAAQVVFEKERMDNSLNKACLQLSSVGMEADRAWLEKQVVQSANRDFKIKTHSIKAAQEREAPSEKLKKRNSTEISESGTPKRKKTSMIADVEIADGGDSDEDSSASDACAGDASIFDENSYGVSNEGMDVLTDSDDE